MVTTLVISLYAAVGTLVTAYTLYHGVINRPRRAIFSFTDQAILGVTSLAVGMLWLFFVPGLAVLATRQLNRYVAARYKGWGLHRAEQLRAG